MEKDRRLPRAAQARAQEPGRRIKEFGIQPRPVCDLMPQSGSWCLYQVSFPARSLGPEICSEPATPVGSLFLDTGAIFFVTLEIPAPLYLRMEMLALNADIEAISQPCRLDAAGCLREANLWEIEGRYSPDSSQLAVRNVFGLDRISCVQGARPDDWHDGGRSLARYDLR